jgi:hypothetical protein
MPGKSDEKHDGIFYQHRDETFSRVIALIDRHIEAVTPSIQLSFNEMSPDKLQAGAEKEVWSLFLRGVRHLKDGAPAHQPGSMTEALSQASLRSSAFAAALGVKPPQFEQMYFSVDYTTGQEAALFFCRRLVEAAEGDLSKSRQIIQQKILAEKPSGVIDGGTLKRQMAISFDVLAETYSHACHDLRSALVAMSPSSAPKPGGKNFDF